MLCLFARTRVQRAGEFTFQGLRVQPELWMNREARRLRRAQEQFGEIFIGNHSRAVPPADEMSAAAIPLKRRHWGFAERSASIIQQSPPVALSICAPMMRADDAWRGVATTASKKPAATGRWKRAECMRRACQRHAPEMSLPSAIPDLAAAA